MVSPVLGAAVVSGTLPLAFLGNFMGMDGLLVLIVAILIFGRKLPEVGKNLGKTIVEFKRGLAGGGARMSPPSPIPNRLMNLRSSTLLTAAVSVNSNLERLPHRPQNLPQTEEV